jgi:hypothetical protein
MTLVYPTPNIKYANEGIIIENLYFSDYMYNSESTCSVETCSVSLFENGVCT